MKIFKTATMDLVKKSLNVYTREHEAIAKNVANATDPNYKRVNTDFSKLLQSKISQRLNTSNERHISHSTIPEEPPFLNKEAGQDRVDIATEMGELATNQIKFDFAARVLQGMYTRLNESIVGRSK